jgi:hypothetical protein
MVSEKCANSLKYVIWLSSRETFINITLLGLSNFTLIY